VDRIEYPVYSRACTLNADWTYSLGQPSWHANDLSRWSRAEPKKNLCPNLFFLKQNVFYPNQNKKIHNIFSMSLINQGEKKEFMINFSFLHVA
jgi:hypothetical protein